jgi:hypothetical protein
LAIDFFHSLFGAAIIDPHRSRRMQGLPPKYPKEYTPLLPNSSEGSPEGENNKDVASEIGISTLLKESILPINLLLSVVRYPLLLQINSSRDIVAEDYTRIATRPHT